MNADEYLKAAMRTYNGECVPNLVRALTAGDGSYREWIGALICAGFGLSGEGGEFSDHLKKHLFHGHPLDREHLIKEIGDVLWYAALAAYALKIPLGDVMSENIAKLQARYPTGFTSEASINRTV